MTTRRALATGALGRRQPAPRQHCARPSADGGSSSGRARAGARGRRPREARAAAPESRALPPAVPAMPVPRAAAEMAEAPTRRLAGIAWRRTGRARRRRHQGRLPASSDGSRRACTWARDGSRRRPTSERTPGASSRCTPGRRARAREAQRSAIPRGSRTQPDMVAVTPDRGREVEITVLREGRSTLTVAEDGVSKTLTVNAVQRSGVWRVDISQ